MHTYIQPQTPNPYIHTYANPNPPQVKPINLSWIDGRPPPPPPATQIKTVKTKPKVKPQTTNPKPQTPNPKPQTPNPKPQTPNPKPQTPNCRWCSPSSTHKPCDLPSPTRFAVCGLRFAVCGLRFGVCGLVCGLSFSLRF